LDEPELLPLRACVVLQAYLPDAFPLQRELTAWSTQRVARGGAPIRLRLVKGANLAMERVESAQRGWALPIFGSKLEVDASYKRMLDFATRPEHARAVELGIASHNLFDVALGLLLRASRGVEAHVGFELLEGMADPLRRVLRALGQDVLVYCPVVDEASMQTAIAYLLRRLDENTAEENFLRRSFAMHSPADAAFAEEHERFERACELSLQSDERARRTQDRRVVSESELRHRFTNEPDTDFSLAQNREWIAAALGDWRERARFDVPLQVGGELSFDAAACADGFDPSRPDMVPYRHALAGEHEIERALQTASEAAKACARTSVEERTALLGAIAKGLRARRGELVAAMVLDAGKRVDQADTEVSEAIDFAEYYAASYAEHARSPELQLAPKGVVLVTPPWNFPLAIPAGGVFAALVAGNAVLLKPATETVLVAERLADVCWQAGVSKHALQLVLCEDELGSRLVRDERVSCIVLTGATSTARLFQKLRPGVDLLAETGGKNAVVISALADRDQAIKDVLQSAFGHAGQKCSAASLLICEAEVYDDPAFLRTLQDATESLPVGSAWDLRSMVTPLIRPPSEALLRGLTTLEPGERWLVQPRAHADNPRLWSPGVKLDVKPGSFTHLTELFGPVLGVMRANDLDHAIELVNATPYGLTSGLFSLDEHEQRAWSERVQAGNLYVNRGVTGAIVRRQPFGGWKASSFGPGAKAGGPSYVLELSRTSDGSAPRALDPPHPNAAVLLGYLKRYVDPGDHRRLAAAACAYQHQMRTYFNVQHDPSGVLGEMNVLRYWPASPLLVRAASDAVLGEALLACIAGSSADAKLTLSVDPSLVEKVAWLSGLPLITFVSERATECAERIARVLRVRAIGSVESEVARAAETAQVHVEHAPVSFAGRVELGRYLREQSLSVSYHRSGYCEGRRLLPWAPEA
ncbi:MAG TPA: proline dehydrogenase family protein, partial [Polyangiales bacterium]|nr:proline dehydrogenase family protein [Polyangiales bacterium]